MKVLRFILVFLAISVFHFVAGLGVFGYSLNRGMGRFDTGERPGAFDKLCDVAVEVLWFPAVLLWRAMGTESKAGQSLVLVANSLLWGAALCGLFVLIARYRRRSRATSNAA